MSTRYRPLAQLDLKQLRAIILSTLMLTSMLTIGGIAAADTNGSQPVMCSVIDTPGNYHLSEDLTGLSSTCIEITSSDVTFDGNGHSIVGDSPDSHSYGLFANGTGGKISNIVIKNVQVTGWDSSGSQGIRFENVNGGEIANVNANDNDVSGIELYDTSHVTVSNVYASGNSRGLGFNFAEGSYVSAGNVIEHSTFENNNAGIRAQGIEDTVIRDTTLDNNERGFWKDGGVNTLIERTSASNNDNEGFRFDLGPSNSTLKDSEASNNGGEAGVYLQRSTNIVVENVTAENNNQAGIYATDTSSTGRHALLNNTVRNHGFAGIWLDGSRGTTISGTTATDNRAGILLRIPNNNTVTGTHATNNDVGIEFDGDARSATIEGTTTVSDSYVAGNSAWGFTENGNDHDYVVENLDIGDSTAANTTVSFEGDGVSIRGVSSPPTHTEPSIDRYFEAQGSELDVDVHYLEGDVEGVSEGWLRLWKHDGSEWSEVEGSSVDTAAKTVSATITDFSTFGVFESEPSVIFNVTVDETNDPVTAGEQLRVTTTIENTGDDTGTQTIQLRNGTTVLDSNKSVTLDAGESTTFDLVWNTTAPDAGTHDLVVESGSDSAQVSVTVDPLLLGPLFDVTIDSADRSVIAGETLTVEATIENTGDTTGQQTVQLNDTGFSNSVQDSRLLSLDAGQSTSVVLEWSTDIDDIGLGTITVHSANTSDSTTVSVLAGTEPPTIEDIQVSTDLTNDEVTITATVEGVSSEVKTVELGLRANFTSYRIVESPADGATNGSLSVTIAAADVIADGDYTGFVRATDELGNRATETNGSVTIDTTPATINSRIERLSQNPATLNITANENVTLSELNITAIASNGATDDRTPTLPTDSTDEFSIEFDGTKIGTETETVFEVTFTATDDAGNSDTHSVKSSFTSYTIENNVATFAPNSSVGVFDLNTNITGGSKSTNASVSQSTTPSTGTALASNQSAALFIDVVDIGLDQAAGELENATVKVPLSEITVPGFANDELVFFYSPAGESGFETVETQLVTEGGDQYLVATVPGFSQLAPGGVDNTPPTVDSTSVTPSSPEDGDDVTVTFEYSPVISEIDISATDVSVSGIDASNADIQITKTTATVDFESLDAGDSIDLTLSVTDTAGNTATETVSVTVSSSDGGGNGGGSSPGSGSSGSGPSTPVDSETDETVEELIEDSGDDTTPDADSDPEPATPESGSDAASGDTPTEDDTPGFGILLAVLALLAVSAVGRKG